MKLDFFVGKGGKWTQILYRCVNRNLVSESKEEADRCFSVKISEVENR